MAVSKDIIKYAKKLYMQANEQGNHVYSLQDICNKIKEDKVYNKDKTFTLSKMAVSKWVKKYEWDNEYDKNVSKAAVIEQGKEDKYSREIDQIMLSSRYSIEKARSKVSELTNLSLDLMEFRLKITYINNSGKGHEKYSQKFLDKHSLSSSELPRYIKILMDKDSHYERLVEGRKESNDRENMAKDSDQFKDTIDNWLKQNPEMKEFVI